MLTSNVKVRDFIVFFLYTFLLVLDDGLLSQNMKHTHFRRLQEQCNQAGVTDGHLPCQLPTFGILCSVDW
jgi:hypothetical protein